MELSYLHVDWNMHYPQFMNTEKTIPGLDSYYSIVEERSVLLERNSRTELRRQERPAPQRLIFKWSLQVEGLKLGGRNGGFLPS